MMVRSVVRWVAWSDLCKDPSWSRTSAPQTEQSDRRNRIAQCGRLIPILRSFTGNTIAPNFNEVWWPGIFRQLNWIFRPFIAVTLLPTADVTANFSLHRRRQGFSQLPLTD